MKTEIRNSISGLLLIPLVLACFALLPSVQAAPDPAPPPGANTRDGAGAMANVTTGNFNTAFGTNALNTLTTGNNNAAQGNSALFSNNGSGNVGVGNLTLRLNTTGSFNTAVGGTVLNSNVTGSRNAALGYAALRSNTADENVAIGWSALFNNTTGTGNTAVGSGAGVGIVTASNMVAINVPAAGPFADIGNTCFIGSIHNQPVSDAASAQDTYVDQYNVLGFLPSSRRFKHHIKPMDKASEVILALKPVTYIYNSDKKGTAQYGLIAEEVAEVAPDLVFRDKNGDVQTVRFEQIGAMLLNEFLKEHRTVQELKSTAARQEANAAKQEATIAHQQKQIEALTAGLQKVSAQVEMSRSAPRTVANK